MVATAITFSVLGGLFEIAGLVIVVLGIWHDQELAKQLTESPPRRPPTRKYPPPVPKNRGANPFGGPSVRYGQDYQHRKLVAWIKDLETSVANGFLKLWQGMDARDDLLATTLRGEMAHDDAKLRSALREVLTGTARQRAWGAGFLGMGIVFGAAGSVIGTLA